VVESWVNDYSGESSTTAPTSAPSSAASTTSGSSASSSPSASSSESSASSTQSSDSSSSSSSSSSGDWSRQAYYNASSGTADGLVFLNHYGGDGSGVFDYVFGNSLSYASPDGTTGAGSPQVLEATTLPSTAEVVVMSNNQCGGEDDDCGYYRPSTVAYHGFDGAEKAFLFQFQMPSVGQVGGSSTYSPVNMPAIWLLNAQIPRTLQYGNASCSCWASGCGEFDIFEVLAPGDSRCKSTLHGNIAGGDSDYFERPVDSPITAALVMYANDIHIQILDDGTDFGDTLDSDTINNIISSTSTQTNSVSLFSLAGSG